MKSRIHFLMKFTFFTTLLLLACIVPAHAQDPTSASFPEISTLTVETFFRSTVEPLYGMLIILWGYLSGYVPGIKKWAPFTRVIAFAVALGLGWHLYGGSIWQLAWTYFLSSGLYVVFLQNILKSPKAQG